MKNLVIRRCSAILFLAALSAPAALAQHRPRTFSVDVAANAGADSLTAYTGANTPTGINNTIHAEFGASAGINLFKQLAVVGEFNYLSQGTQPLPGSTTGTLQGNAKMYGAAVRYAPFSFKYFTPYLVGGTGYITNSITATNAGTSVYLSQNGDYISYGAGANIYVYRGWGIRPEFRQDHAAYQGAAVTGGVSTARQNANRGTVAIFYEFGGKSSK